MESIPVDGLHLFFEPQERESAGLFMQACQRSLSLLHETWNLETPGDCRVYIMTSWKDAVYHAAPATWRFRLATSFVWRLRARRLWPVIGGWTFSFGKRRMVGVKPAWLMRQADRSLGEKLFISEDDFDIKVEQVLCHELTHAFHGAFAPDTLA